MNVLVFCRGFFFSFSLLDFGLFVCLFDRNAYTTPFLLTERDLASFVLQKRTLCLLFVPFFCFAAILDDDLNINMDMEVLDMTKKDDNVDVDVDVTYYQMNVLNFHLIQ